MSAFYTTLIFAEELQTLLQQPKHRVVILEASFDLADPEAGERQYNSGHLPEAQYAHLDRDLCGVRTGLNGRHPLPTLAAFAQTAGTWGINPEVQVVVYDRQEGMYAARLWWMLRWLGHSAVAVLNGGLPAWLAEKGALSTAAPHPVSVGPYPIHCSQAARVDRAALQNGLEQLCLLDARSPERFSGQVEPIDPVAGHIPGAINRFFKQNLEASGLFKSADALHSEFLELLGEQPAERVVHQCGSGVTACHNLLAMEVAGLPGSRLYPGSWSEWCAHLTEPAVLSPQGFYV